jgi:hypothetical protein
LVGQGPPTKIRTALRDLLQIGACLGEAKHHRARARLEQELGSSGGRWNRQRAASSPRAPRADRTRRCAHISELHTSCSNMGTRHETNQLRYTRSSAPPLARLHTSVMVSTQQQLHLVNGPAAGDSSRPTEDAAPLQAALGGRCERRRCTHRRHSADPQTRLRSSPARRGWAHCPVPDRRSSFRRCTCTRGITTHPPHGKHIVVCDARQCNTTAHLQNAVITKASA